MTATVTRLPTAATPFERFLADIEREFESAPFRALDRAIVERVRAFVDARDGDHGPEAA